MRFTKHTFCPVRIFIHGANAISPVINALCLLTLITSCPCCPGPVLTYDHYAPSLYCPHPLRTIPIMLHAHYAQCWLYPISNRLHAYYSLCFLCSMPIISYVYPICPLYLMFALPHTHCAPCQLCPSSWLSVLVISIPIFSYAKYAS